MIINRFINITLKVLLCIILIAAVPMCFISLYGSSIAGTIVISLVMAASLFMGYKIINSNMDNRKKALLLFAIAAALRILWLMNADNTPNSDFNTMYYEGNQFIHGNSQVFKGTSYAARFPHFIMTILYMGLMQYLFPQTNLCAMKGVNLFLGLVVIWIIYAAANEIFEDRKKSLYTLLIACIFPPFITYTSVFCSENLAMPFYMGAVLLFLKAVHKSNGNISGKDRADSCSNIDSYGNGNSYSNINSYVNGNCCGDGNSNDNSMDSEEIKSKSDINIRSDIRGKGNIKDNRKSFEFLIMSGIVLGIGNLLRMIADVVLIAYVLYIVIYFKDGILKKIADILCVTLPYFMILVCVSTGLQKMNITENPLWRGSEPKITSVLRGTNISSLGMWNVEDTAVAENNIGNYDEIEKECKDIIYQRLTTTNPLKLTAFYIGKVASQWCIGDFSGSLWTQKDMAAEKIIFKIGMFGSMPLQIIYSFILMMIFYGLRNRKNIILYPELNLFYIIFLGYIGAYLLTENQCRYGYIASWLFVVLGADGITSFIEIMKKKHCLSAHTDTSYESNSL